MIVAVSSILEAFLRAGGEFFQEAKLRSALVNSLRCSAALLGTWPLEAAVSSTTLHLTCCIAMTRAYARESVEGSSTRRFPKSGGLRQKLGLESSTLMEKLAALLGSQPPPVQDDPADVALTSYDKWLHADSDFEGGVAESGVDGAEDCAVVGTDSSDEEWPDWCKPTTNDTIDPITPVASKRKAAAKSAETTIEPITPVAPTKAAAKSHDTPTKSTKARKPTKAKAQKKSCPNKFYFKTIEKVRKTLTKEVPSRLELTGLVPDGDEAWRRIHICTIGARSHGAKFEQFGNELTKLILRHKMTKTESDVVVKNHRV